MATKTKDRSEILGTAISTEEPPKLAIEMRLDELATIFKTAVDAIEEMIAPGEDGKIPELTTEGAATLAEIVGPQVSAPERVDQVVALIRHREYQEQLLRLAIRNAEMKARTHKAFVNSMKGSLELYMLERGIKRIDGFASTLKIAKCPDKLEIGNEEFIPDGFFDFQVTFRLPKETTLDDIEQLKAQLAEEHGLEFVTGARILDTELLKNHLNSTETVIDSETKEVKTKFKEVAGAELLRDRRRLDVK